MQSNNYIHSKKQLSKWLVALTLFLSCLFTQGYVRQARAVHQQKATSEWVVTVATARQNVFYDKISCGKSKVRQYVNYSTPLIAYNNLVKVKLIHITQHASSFKRAPHFLQVKTIPADADNSSLIA